MTEPCDLGDIEFVWRADHPLLFLLETHGVDAGGTVGVMQLDEGTIVGKSSQEDLRVGDVIRHSAALCDSGRHRYAS